MVKATGNACAAHPELAQTCTYQDSDKEFDLNKIHCNHLFSVATARCYAGNKEAHPESIVLVLDSVSMRTCRELERVGFPVQQIHVPNYNHQVAEHATACAGSKAQWFAGSLAEWIEQSQTLFQPPVDLSTPAFHTLLPGSKGCESDAKSLTPFRKTRKHPPKHLKKRASSTKLLCGAWLDFCGTVPTCSEDVALFFDRLAPFLADGASFAMTYCRRSKAIGSALAKEREDYADQVESFLQRTATSNARPLKPLQRIHYGIMSFLLFECLPTDFPLCQVPTRQPSVAASSPPSHSSFTVQALSGEEEEEMLVSFCTLETQAHSPIDHAPTEPAFPEERFELLPSAPSIQPINVSCVENMPPRSNDTTPPTKPLGASVTESSKHLAAGVSALDDFVLCDETTTSASPAQETFPESTRKRRRTHTTIALEEMMKFLGGHFGSSLQPDGGVPSKRKRLPVCYKDPILSDFIELPKRKHIPVCRDGFVEFPKRKRAAVRRDGYIADNECVEFSKRKRTPVLCDGYIAELVRRLGEWNQ